jgi:hypothetical protein
MILSNCISCGLPVVELQGQYAVLDAIYARGSQVPLDSVGRWHPICLATSDVAQVWFEARAKNYREMRRYEVLLETPDWIVLADPQTREPLALGRSGVLLSLAMSGRSRARRVSGGAVYPLQFAEFNLELAHTDENEQTITAIQDALASDRTYPLPSLMEALGIAHKVMHPEALEHGVFRANRGGPRHWGRYAVAARVEYGVFLPAELESHVVAEPSRDGAG